MYTKGNNSPMYGYSLASGTNISQSPTCSITLFFPNTFLNFQCDMRKSIVRKEKKFSFEPAHINSLLVNVHFLWEVFCLFVFYLSHTSDKKGQLPFIYIFSIIQYSHVTLHEFFSLTLSTIIYTVVQHPLYNLHTICSAIP